MATFIASHGYEVRRNVVLEGRSGARHEVDVVGEKSDALSTFRIAIECKAWNRPIEKDVVAKFSYVLNDLGMREGIVVALGGYRAGADAAATELGITLWGPDELRERIGPRAVADLTTRAPRALASGLSVRIDDQRAHALINREARGPLGVGGESVVWSSLVWLPIAIVQLAMSRTEGRIKQVTRTRRLWNAYELVNGGLVASWSNPPHLVEVDLGGRSLRPRQKATAATTSIAQAIDKYSSVSTAAARARHGARMDQLGLPAGFAVVAEQTSTAFAPLYVAIAQRKGAERLIVVDARAGQVHPGLSASLSEHIHWLRESLTREATTWL